MMITTRRSLLGVLGALLVLKPQTRRGNAQSGVHFTWGRMWNQPFMRYGFGFIRDDDSRLFAEAVVFSELDVRDALRHGGLPAVRAQRAQIRQRIIDGIEARRAEGKNVRSVTEKVDFQMWSRS